MYNVGVLNERIFPSSGLQSYWRMNEVSGTTATDIVGGKSGTITTGAFDSTGKDKYCYKRTTKVGAGMSIGNNYAFEYTDTFSWNMWVNWAELNAWSLFFSKENSSSYKGYGLFKNTSNQVYCEIRGTTLIQNKNTGNTITSTGVWYMVTLTYNGSGANTGAEVYINANKNGQSRTGSVSSSMVTTQTLTFGSYAADLNNGLKGSMDEIAVWNRVLTQEEITALYNLGTGIYY